MSGGVRCPRCGNQQVYGASRGYSGSSGALGCLLIGPLGLLLGLLGAGRPTITCMQCGHRWKIRRRRAASDMLGCFVVLLLAGVLIGLVGLIVGLTPPAKPVDRRTPAGSAKPLPAIELPTREPVATPADDSTPAGDANESRPATAARPELRTWIDQSGRHSTRARFLGVDGVTVRLEKADGQRIVIPLKSLSREDRNWVIRHR